MAEIVVTDGAHGERSLVISVAVSPPPGPTGVRFTPAVLSLEVETSATLSYEVYDAQGHAIAAPGPLLLATPSDGLSVNGTSVTALKAGHVTLNAKLADGTLLAGSLNTFNQPHMKAGSSNEPCDGSVLKVAWAAFANPPEGFNRPDASMTLLLDVVALLPESCPFPKSARAWEQSPEAIRFSVGGVADITADGLLTAQSPGWTTMTATLDGADVGDPWRFSVGLDIGGAWTFDCENGDHGSISVEAELKYALPACGAHGFHAGGCGQGSLAISRNGTSCVSPCTDCSGSSPKQCSGQGQVTTGGRPTPGCATCTQGVADDLLCSDATPCKGSEVGFGDCAGHAGLNSRILGPDSVKTDTCTYTRAMSSAPTCSGMNTNLTCAQCAMNEATKYHNHDYEVCDATSNQTCSLDSISGPGNDYCPTHSSMTLVGSCHSACPGLTDHGWPAPVPAGCVAADDAVLFPDRFCCPPSFVSP